MPAAIFDVVREHRPTLFFGVPTSYANMLDAIDDIVAVDFTSIPPCVNEG